MCSRQARYLILPVNNRFLTKSENCVSELIKSVVVIYDSIVNVVHQAVDEEHPMVVNEDSVVNVEYPVIDKKIRWST